MKKGGENILSKRRNVNKTCSGRKHSEDVVLKDGGSEERARRSVMLDLDQEIS